MDVKTTINKFQTEPPIIENQVSEHIMYPNQRRKEETKNLPKNGKIKTIQELADIITSLHAEDKSIVYCHGFYDLLHIGHIRHFEQARGMGDILIVTVTTDPTNHGVQDITFTETQRAEAIASLNCVDYVAINKWPTAEEALRLLRPDIYVKGSEFKNSAAYINGDFIKEKQVAHEIGTTLAFTEEDVFSSTNRINRHLLNLPIEINKYLELFRSRYNLDEILQILDKMSSLNVLVIGDTILDDYQYCQAIGKSSKDPALALKYQSHDMFAGGILAVANHVANFVNSVKLVTVLGERDSHEEFIRSQLHPNVSPFFAIQPNAPTLIKRRFIDGYSISKLFEVYIMDDSGLPSKKNKEVCNWLKEQLPKYDLVIAADFGHGAISNEMVKILIDHSRFITVNTQANAGNRGFHTISRYPSINYACIAEHELRLETRSYNGAVRPMMLNLAKKLGCLQFAVTRGREGCAICDEKGSFVQVPAFAQKIVDRVGAGDAFLSLTSLASLQGAPIEVLGFIGNAVGSLAVGILGNKKAIDKESIKNYITSLIK